MLGSSKISSNINQPPVQYDQGSNPPAAAPVTGKALVSTPSLNVPSEHPSFLSQPTFLNTGLNGGGGPKESNSVVREDQVSTSIMPQRQVSQYKKGSGAGGAPPDDQGAKNNNLLQSKVKAINEGLFDDKLNFIPTHHLQNFGNLDESGLFEEQKSMMILGNYDGMSNPLEQSEIFESNEFLREMSKKSSGVNPMLFLQKVDSKQDYEQSSPVILHQSNRQEENDQTLLLFEQHLAAANANLMPDRKSTKIVRL